MFSFRIKMIFLFFGNMFFPISIITATNSNNLNPEIGVYQMNYKYEKVKVLSEVPNSNVNLPLQEPSYYTVLTYQLVCNASYPIQWKYSGFGYPQVHVTTSRLPSNVPGEEFSKIFETRVIFSFTEPSQSGNYSCQSLSNPELISYFGISIAGENGTSDYFTQTIHQTAGSYISRNSLHFAEIEDDIIKCCSKSIGYPKLRSLNCDSVSDCGIKLSYMENKPKCKGRTCNPEVLKTKQKIENGEKCSEYQISGEKGLIQCSAATANAQNEYLMFTTSEKDNRIITTFTFTPPTTDILTLYLEPVGLDEIYISCIPNWFFFSQGIRWAVKDQTQNGPQLKFLTDDKINLRVKKKDFVGKTVFCFAPLWDSVDWRNVSIPIVV